MPNDAHVVQLLEKLIQKVDRVERKLSVMLAEKKADIKPMWVKSTEIKRLTGWDHEQMRTARNRNYIKWEKRADGFFYDMNSLNDRLIRSKP